MFGLVGFGVWRIAVEWLALQLIWIYVFTYTTEATVKLNFYGIFDFSRNYNDINNSIARERHCEPDGERETERDLEGERARELTSVGGNVSNGISEAIKCSNIQIETNFEYKIKCIKTSFIFIYARVQLQ